MEYEDPFRLSESQIDFLRNMVDQITLETNRADEMYELACDWRADVQSLLAEEGGSMSDEYIARFLCLWYGTAYLIQALGENGLCKHEMKRFDCGICSRNVYIRKEGEGDGT